MTFKIVFVIIGAATVLAVAIISLLLASKAWHKNHPKK